MGRGYNDDGEETEEKEVLMPSLGQNHIILEARRLAEEAGVFPADAKMMLLPEVEFVQIVEWLLQRVPAYKIPDLVKKEFNLPEAKVPEKNALYRFEQRFMPFFSMARRRWASQQAQARTDEAAKDHPDWDAAAVDAIKQATCEALENPVPDVKLARILVTGFGKVRQQEIEWKKLRDKVQSKIDAGIEELAKELPADLVAKIRETLAAKMEEK